jgi:hypothetical protein
MLHRDLSGALSLSWLSLVAPSGRCTQSEGKTYELLLITHFPNSEVTKELAALAAAFLARCPHWRLAARVVTYRWVESAIDSFALYKIPSMGGIFPTLLQQEREAVIPFVV